MQDYTGCNRFTLTIGGEARNCSFYNLRNCLYDSLPPERRQDNANSR